jgi:hypothetical protein
MDPRFEDAREHDPTKITLLCGSHQLESSKRLLSLETIQRWDASPITKQRGYANHLFDLGGKIPSIDLKSVGFPSPTGRLLTIQDEIFLKVSPPELHSRLWRLSARFHDEDGTLVCSIIDNELEVLNENFDVEQTGARFTVRSGERRIVADFRIEPPGLLVVDRMNCKVGPSMFRITPDEFHITGPETDFTMTKITLGDGVGLHFDGKNLTFGPA